MAQGRILLSIDEIMNGDFPTVQVIITALNAQGIPIEDLTPGNFSLSEAGREVTNLVVTPIFEHPLDIALVLDTSATMAYGEKPTAMENIAQAAREFIDSLAAEDQVALIAFSNDVRILQDLNADKSVLPAHLNSLIPQGNSALNDALTTALNLFKDRAKRPVIILLTDGFDSGISDATFEEVIKQADEQNVVVYPVGWRAARGSELQKLAELTFGRLQYLDEPNPGLSWFQAAFSSISKSLHTLRLQYKIEYLSSLLADGAEYELVVKVDYLGDHVEQSRRFTTLGRMVKVSLPDYIDGQVTGGIVKFAPQVSAPAPVKRLDISVDGALLTSLTSPPFEYEWDSSKYPAGEHILSFEVEDMAGNAGEATLRLVVQPPIMVRIIAPTRGASIRGRTQLVAEVTAISTISRVEFWADGNLLETLESGPYEVNWDTSSVPAGPHILKVAAVDINGFSAEDELSVNVEIGQGLGAAWLALLAVVVLAGVLIPIGLRTRKKRSTTLQKAAEPVAESSEAIPSLVPGEPFLRELEGMNPNHIWVLTTEEVRLGRKRGENDIPLKGLRASRYHALIRNVQGQFVVSSVNPENPIFVNNTPVYQQQTLQPGDILRAGDTVLRFEIQGQAE